MLSDMIKPLPHLHRGEGTSPKRKFLFDENNKTIYPKLPNGKSICVTIIRRKLESNTGMAFHVTRNAGRWSYKIEYPFADKVARLGRSKFLKELKRVGALEHAGQLLSGSA